MWLQKFMNIHHCIFKILGKKLCRGRTHGLTDNVKTVYLTTNKVSGRYNMHPKAEPWGSPDNTRQGLKHTVKNNFCVRPDNQAEMNISNTIMLQFIDKSSMGYLIERLGKVCNKVCLWSYYGLRPGFPGNHEWTGPAWSRMTYHFWSQAGPQLFFTLFLFLIFISLMIWKIVHVLISVDVLRPSESYGVMSSAVSLPNHTTTGQA